MAALFSRSERLAKTLGPQALRSPAILAIQAAGRIAAGALAACQEVISGNSAHMNATGDAE